MNTTTQTTDERCAELAANAEASCIRIAQLRSLGAPHSTRRSVCYHMDNASVNADRIIALRAAELAQGDAL